MGRRKTPKVRRSPLLASMISTPQISMIHICRVKVYPQSDPDPSGPRPSDPGPSNIIGVYQYACENSRLVPFVHPGMICTPLDDHVHRLHRNLAIIQDQGNLA